MFFYSYAVLPRVEPYDLMIVMGGPQDVWEEDQYPWMRTEKEAIRTAIIDDRIEAGLHIQGKDRL